MTRRRLTPGDRRDELIQFGRDHFAEQAYDALPLHQIAERAGVSKGTLYNYFGGRRGFYIATIEAVVDEVLVAITPPSGASLEDALHAMTRELVDYAVSNAPIYIALVKGGLGADAEVAERLDRVREAAHRHIVDALGIDPTPAMTLMISGWVAFVEATTARWLVQKSITIEALVSLFENNLITLLGATHD